MPAEITLPAFLEEKLRDAPHRHVVQKALHDFSDWIRVSERPFFKDYTDHDIQHITQVLTTAANFIPESARPHFSGADAAALILAVLFHDSALHLSEAGFHYLIKGSNTPYAPLPAFDSTDWPQTWADFMFLARRWDDAKILGVFGGDNGVPTAAVRDPFPHWDDLKRTDKLLVGEFIRQHHPRLAHEMALHGVPGVSGPLLKLDESLPSEWRDLVGLIARSHGLPLRACLDYLKNAPDFGEEARREYQGIHAVYLMALLRVADYVQIQGDRTSNRIFTYKKIYSGVSTIEHKAHQAVRNITTTTDDPEALFIQARPDEVAVFLRLQEWLAGIQQELDGSWAVLGEVYGRHEGLKNLGLTFRRVRSNLDSVKEFAKTVSYVPDRIRFDVARAELLKLLIGPLYGDDPSYGVRELMQNSIDAVREYDQFVLDNTEYASVPRREQEADVVIELGPFDEAKGYAVMTISDRGIGMTEATIRDYFLRAGASYRRSSEWKKNFEIQDADKSMSKVLRSGRFGIGALAAFLIGKEIEVETRHLTAQQGYVFTTLLETEEISVEHKDLPIGTSIAIKISQAAHQALLLKHQKKTLPNRFGWYLFDKPSVLRIWYSVDGARTQKTNQLLAPRKDEHIWRKLDVNYPYEVYWTLSGAPALTCNGIFVSNSSALRYVPYGIAKQSPYVNTPLELPLVSVLDPQGAFPLNLQRDNIRTDCYEFDISLLRDVLQEMLAWLLFNGPNDMSSNELMRIDFPWLAKYARNETLIASKFGFAIKLAVVLDGLAIRYAVNYKRDGFELDFVKDDVIVFLRHTWHNTGDHFANVSVVNGLEGDEDADVSCRVVLYFHPYSEKSAPRGKMKVESYTTEEKRFFLEQQKKGWLISKEAGCPPKEFIVKKWPEIRISSPYDEERRIRFFEEYFFPENSFIKSVSEPWLLDELWQEHFGKDWIPFALEDRIAKFPKAAQFFKERYPQVVPDEAWDVLGGKPA